MIIGNPYKFSIFMKIIKEWNIDDSFCNGILMFGINGEIFPKEVTTAILKCEISVLKEELRNPIVDKEFYIMSKEEAFTKIYNIT